MNSNWKLLPATLLVAVLALAGCGGGGSDDMTPDPMPTPTPQEQCTADGGIYEDGTCKSAEDLRNEGRDAEKEAEAAKAMLAMAKKLRGILAVEAVAVTTTAPASSTPSDDVVTALGKANDADDGAGKENDAQVMVYDNKGPATKESTDATAITDVAAITPRLVMGSGFATGSAEVKTHDNGSTVRGSYNGATGGFACGGTDCTSQKTKNGIQLVGTWTFDPDQGQKYDAADADYASYGWWLDEGITTADAAQAGAWYVVMQGTAITADEVTAASGTATYNGQAVGKAAYYHSRGGDSNIGGHFTANAELMADFDANMLGGSITGFNVGGMNPGWSVELMKQTIADTGVAAAADSTKWTVDGTAGAAGGSWSAAFYGKPADEHQPTGVAGGFEASFESDGYMVGAFGAER